MKKLPEPMSTSESFSGIRLYLDDIELILSTYVDNGYSVTIKDDQYEYESLEELIGKKGLSPYFEIEGEQQIDGRSRSVSFSATKNSVKIYSIAISGESLTSTYARLINLCTAKKSRLVELINDKYNYLYLMFGCAVVAGISNGIGLRYFAWFCIASFPVFTGLYLYVEADRSIISRVMLRRRHEGGFWKRNAEKIILLLIGALMGLILKLIFDMILKVA